MWRLVGGMLVIAWNTETKPSLCIRAFTEMKKVLKKHMWYRLVLWLTFMSTSAKIFSSNVYVFTLFYIRNALQATYQHFSELYTNTKACTNTKVQYVHNPLYIMQAHTYSQRTDFLWLDGRFATMRKQITIWDTPTDRCVHVYPTDHTDTGTLFN